MARELPIRNGRLTTDLNADGHLILNLRGGVLQAQSDWNQTDATAPDFIKNKPAVPAVDTALATPGAAADAKAVGDALRGGYTEWVAVRTPTGYTTFISCEWNDGMAEWHAEFSDGGVDRLTAVASASKDATVISTTDFELRRHLITPTKTSQLTNDGAPGGGGTPYATTAQVAAKQDALSAAQLENIASVPNKANSADVATAIAGVRADLPYALVTANAEMVLLNGPLYLQEAGGEYEEIPCVVVSTQDGYSLVYQSSQSSVIATFDSSGDFIEWIEQGFTLGPTHSSEDPEIGLGAQLAARAGNRVVITGDTTLTLPAAVPGYLRDFLVRLEISGSPVPTITFAASGSESVTYETDGDEFPAPDAEGTWLYSFTETDSGVFAVALKQVQTVAQASQAQGGV